MDQKPNWFSVTGRGNGSVDGVCIVIDGTATSDREYAITIREVDNEIYARETTPGLKFPIVCYDRHIMSGGDFCVGVSSGTWVESPQSARKWWSSLSEFLRLQGVASSTGRWPRTMELDHGQAAVYHRSALDAAAELGVLEEYELSLIGKPSWTTRLLTRDGKSLINGRAACPVGCERNGRRLLRCECCSKQTVLKLVQSERSRAIALKKFWEEVRNRQMVCCGTMIGCPLRPTATR